MAKGKRGESEGFRADGGVGQECIMSPWLFSHMDIDQGGESGNAEDSRVEIAWLLVSR